MAGLELKMLVKEPTAAAIAYNEDKKIGDSNIMIFDFGGGRCIIIILKTTNRIICINEISGTLDINICKIENGKLAIKAVHGDKHLGKVTFNIFHNMPEFEFNRWPEFRWSNYELCITKIYGIIE